MTLCFYSCESLKRLTHMVFFLVFSQLLLLCKTISTLVAAVVQILDFVSIVGPLCVSDWRIGWMLGVHMLL